MRVIEIFRSIQGEGRNQGRPTTFLRLGGCNLACRWCDTANAREGGDELDAAAVIAAIRDASGSCRRLCVTGGEPLLQQDALIPVLASLADEGYAIECETNGTIEFSSCQSLATITMDVKCPSSGEKSDLDLLARLRPEDSVKFVVADTADLEYAEETLRVHPTRAEIFVSPVHGADVAPLVARIIEEDLPVRFSLQLHKHIGVR
jgi:7-carboxy-7-deazaguanine synthase